MERRELRQELGVSGDSPARSGATGGKLPMLSTWMRIGVCIAALVVAGCERSPSRPLFDGYTLHGIVRDAQSDSLLSEVQVLVGGEGSSEMHLYALTDAAGRFEFRPTPATAPSTELFRCEKAGYAPTEILARTATRIREFEYRLDIYLEPTTP